MYVSIYLFIYLIVCGNHDTFLSGFRKLKNIYIFFVKGIFCNVINVFTVHFDHVNVSFLNKTLFICLFACVLIYPKMFNGIHIFFIFTVIFIVIKASVGEHIRNKH